ncbi:DAK2 domain-containing protein [Tomitella gaofuii]|uniref:DAK2 domain-containing protein n=1 Tax=Tomitella gaofuii TaxID=2760083 RepID=UPI0015FA0943|nr:DAK2 domain-containing protein [Tomitella gaofuii]
MRDPEFDAATVRRWADASVDALTCKRGEIDALNVFPVPDSDTGTNIMHTFAAAAGRVAGGSGGDVGAPTAAAALQDLAAGAVDGARGNSGVILSQVLVGLAQEAAADGRTGALDGRGLSAGLAHGALLARNAVSMPMEGTVLTVIDAAAQGCAGEGTLTAAAHAAAEAAYEALGRTTRQLDVLEAAGVVDAGGLGLLVVLDCLAETLSGRRVQRPTFVRSVDAALGRSGAAITRLVLSDAAAAPAAQGCAAGADEYEVMYLLDDADDAAVSTLRRSLEAAGNSVVIVGDGTGGRSVHVHLQDAGRAVDCGLEAGRIRKVRITHLGVQQRRHTGLRPGRAVLAVVDGAGAVPLFEAAGARVLPVDGSASGSALLAAVGDTDAGEVLVLPNGLVRSEDLVVVSAAARRQGQQVLPLPCSSAVQGLASIAVHDPHRPSSDDTYAMAEAAAATRCAHLRIADTRALTWSGTCEPGDALGVIGGEVMVVEPRASTAVATLLDLMLGTGGELVTLLVGAAADDELVSAARAHVEQRHPAVELSVFPGLQSGDVLQIGVE